jgi:mannose-6-phosphate isomerase
VLRLTNVVQNYAWGSHTAIATLLGQPVPSPVPEAELWMGAHERGPSTVLSASGDAIDLPRAIAAEPDRFLGPRLRATFGDRLPFLLKVLAADRPLSLQAHPDAEQARRGFDEEERSGRPRDDPARNYRDPWHKPELLCALEPFDALCGFRSAAEALVLVDALGDVPELDPLRARLARGDMRGAFEWVLELDPASATVEATTRACPPDTDAAYDWLRHLAAAYPDDAGVLASLLLQTVRLEPFEALFLPARNLHAYLHGVAIELMASSDNVLRGGLTPKHVAKSELLRVLDFDAAPPPIVRPRQTARGVWTYEVPVPEFRLDRIDPSGDPIDLPSSGPQILVCVEGRIEARTGTATPLRRGQSALRCAAEAPLRVGGHGRAFVASVGHLGPSAPGPTPSL